MGRRASTSERFRKSYRVRGCPVVTTTIIEGETL